MFGDAWATTAAVNVLMCVIDVVVIVFSGLGAATATQLVVYSA